MIQLILHLWGDYILQSDWMAQNKTKRWWPAIVHGTVYSLPFLLIASPLAVLVIWSTHIVIDRFRLARYLVWAKNFLAPRTTSREIIEQIPVHWNGVFSSEKIGVTTKEIHLWWLPWGKCSKTGYPDFTPDWLAVWLMILADNTLHLTINYLSIRFL